MQISFYVLSDAKAQDILGFICQLTERVLSKSEQSLLILTEESAFLAAVDEALWAHDALSFIPHQRLPELDEADINDAPVRSVDLPAPVLLGSYLPADFTGIVLNTTAQGIQTFMTDMHQTPPSRVLELIQPDTDSKQVGRDKYKHYQHLNYELTHFQV